MSFQLAELYLMVRNSREVPATTEPERAWEELRVSTHSTLIRPLFCGKRRSEDKCAERRCARRRCATFAAKRFTSRAADELSGV